MFFSGFSERDKKEITVEDVIPEEFVELLNVVYPSHKPITGNFVGYWKLRVAGVLLERTPFSRQRRVSAGTGRQI